MPRASSAFVLPSDIKEAVPLLAERIEAMARELDLLRAAILSPLNAAPNKTPEGAILYADGVSWNPGRGKGLYIFLSGIWEAFVHTLNLFLEEEAWINATLLNSWVTYSSSYGEVAYYKDLQKRVYLRGVCKDGTYATNTVLFYLPTGYRPAKDLLFPITFSGGTGVAYIQAADGGVLIVGVTGNTWLSLSGVSFRAS